MKHPGITAFALSAIITLGACGGESEAKGEDDSSSDTSERGTATSFPEMTDGKGAGTITGTIGGNTVDAQGVCSRSSGGFDFWTDGEDFASANDVTGDGQYLILNIVNMNGKVRSALRYSRNDETLYNGMVSYESFDGSTVRVDTPLGREEKISADFTITCE
jgi:hypothetical protein